MDKLTRKCTHCKRELPLENFHNNARCKYGKYYVCKECRSIYAKSFYTLMSDKMDISPLPGEEWRDIRGYEGLYKVSSLGRVLSLPRLVNVVSGKRRVFPRILKPAITRGYYRVGLMNDGKRELHQVHILVADAFLEKPDWAEELNHKNGKRLDNRVENLEWCTRQYNIWHSYHVNKRSPTRQIPITCEETGLTYNSIMEAARQLGIHDSSIRKTLKKIYKSACGFHFHYAETVKEHE